MKRVNSLDITLDIINDIYLPYNKSNANPLYVPSRPNHSSSIIKPVPLSIEKGKSRNSANDEIFYKHGNF